jgi:nucleoside-diphosphate-sugar epimerase
MTVNALVIGCGYLGRALAMRLLAAGHSVHGTVRAVEGFERLRALGVTPLALDVADPGTHGPLRELLRAHEPGQVYYCVPPGIGLDPAGDVARIASVIAERMPARAVLTSSTAVYGDRDGGAVDADTPVAPADARGRRLLAIERAWLTLGGGARIVRLAGIYGPGRIIGMTTLLHGQRIGGDPDDLLNLIHVDDAAALLHLAAESAGAAAIELGADGSPLRRREYYVHLADRLGVKCEFGEPDNAVETARRRAGSRVCLIGPTCARTGWQPQQRDVRTALDRLLP